MSGNHFAMPSLRRLAMSPSANHRLALTICTILMNCFPAMMGAEIPVSTHGQKLSILFARAISRAPALHGLAKRVVGWATGTALGCSREGESVGEEKESRYNPMKNISFMAQKVNRTA